VDAFWELDGYVAALVSGPDWEHRKNALIDAGIFAIAVPPDADIGAVLTAHESVLPRELAP
jgi:hypothetical protein